MSQKGGSKNLYGCNGLWGLLVLAGDIWAVINIVQSSASNERKLIWTLVVVLLPLLGLVLWYFLEPRDGRCKFDGIFAGPSAALLCFVQLTATGATQ
jgi:hypothetical protein